MPLLKVAYVICIIIMYATPLPVKRRLSFTPYASSAPPSTKRYRSTFPAATSTRAFRNTNRHYTRGAKTGGSLLQQVRSLQRFVNTIKPEVKYVDVQVAANNITTAGNVVHVTAIAQGDTTSTRTGEAVRVVSISYKGTFSSFSTTTPFYRVALVQDLQTISDTAPSAANIFTDGIATANPVTVLPNLATLERFRVLYMSDIYNGLALTAGQQIPYYEFSMMCNIKVDYNGTASTDQQKNAIYAVFLTDDAANVVDYNGVVRLGFTDA